MNVDLSVPIWTIEHVAAALHLEVDTAREYAYRAGFPAPKAAFGRNLWAREEVLVWFAQLPVRDRRSTKAVKGTTTAKQLVLTKEGVSLRPVDAALAVSTRSIKSYKPQRQR